VGARTLRTLSPRNRELLYLAVVGVLTGIGFASVYIARQSLVSWGSLSYALFFLALYLIAHIAARLTVPNADPYLLPMAGLLTAIGVTEIYRLHPDDAFKQGVWIVVGVALFALTLFLLRYDYRALESYKYIFGLTAIALLVLPILPVLGLTVNGARLWVHFGSLRFQPGELAKIMLIIFLAGYMREKREVLAQGRPKDWGPLLVIWVLAMLVLLETRDLGGGLLYFGIFLAMLYVATSRIAYVAAGFGLFLVGALGVWKVTPHVQERVTIWLHPWTEHKVHCPLNGEMTLRQNCQSFQLVKSLYSIGHGGYGGTGLGKGTFFTLSDHPRPIIPSLNTDFIFSALAQEIGLIGAAGLLLIYMVFVLRGIRISLLAQDGFSKLLAAGLTFGFALQTFIIVGGVLRIIPLTGITLPLVSYGGSSVVANFLLLAGLLLVSNRANRELLR
jgi:cell division protein FtsW (lipid II flippase)